MKKKDELFHTFFVQQADNPILKGMNGMFRKEEALKKLSAKIERTKREMQGKYAGNIKALETLQGSLRALEAMKQTIEDGHWDN